MTLLRLTLLIPTLDRSGAEKQLALLACGLPRDEFDVEVVALTRGGPYEDHLRAAGIPVTILGKRLKFDPWSLYQLRQHLAKRRSHLLHSWLFAANAYGRLARGASPETRIIVSERCVDSWKSGWQLKMDRWLWPVTDRLIGNSAAVCDFYAAQGLDRERMLCIPNGVNLPSPDPLARAEILRECGWPDDSFIAVCVGRLAPQKRVQDLIWTTETLRQIRPQLRFVIVGDGPQRHSLEDLSRRVQCTDHVHFAGHRTDADRWIQAADVYWLASEFEGMPNSLMEAMAAGKACIATDLPSTRELLEPAVHGFAAPVQDPVAFMQLTRRLIDEPGLKETLGDAARTRMAEHFTTAAMVSRHVALYRAVAAETPIAQHK